MVRFSCIYICSLGGGRMCSIRRGWVRQNTTVLKNPPLLIYIKNNGDDASKDYVLNTYIKFANSQQTKQICPYKNIREKLYKTNAAIWYNKTRRHKITNAKLYISPHKQQRPPVPQHDKISYTLSFKPKTQNYVCIYTACPG